MQVVFLIIFAWLFVLILSKIVCSNSCGNNRGSIFCVSGITTQWFQMAKNPPRIISLDVISRVFPSKFRQIHITSVSAHSTHLIFRICQIVVGRLMTRQFHEFWKSNFWRVSAIQSNCASPAETSIIFLFFTGGIWVSDCCLAVVVILASSANATCLVGDWNPKVRKNN